MGKYAHRTADPVKVWPPSKTKPGQALIPAELLQRHLAGTLPDIQHNPKFTHDENGQVIGEDLSKYELHELFDLTARARRELAEREAKLARDSDDKYRQKIIEDYEKSKPPKSTTEDTGTEGKPPSKNPPEGS